MARNKYSGQISADLISGNLFESDEIYGPYLCVVGTASSGPSYVLRRISSVSAAVELYGDTDTRFIRDIALALQESPNVNLYCMRIGGTKAEIELTQATSGGKLYIQPQFEDAEIMEKYKIAMMKSTLSGAGANQARLLIYDKDDEIIVFDSDELVVTDLGLFKVTIDASFEYYEISLDTDGNPDFQTSPIYLSDLLDTAGTSFDLTNTQTAFGNSISNAYAITSGKYTAGTDGNSLSNAEKYASLQKGYELISTRYMDYIVPSDVYVDSPNVVDTVSGNDKATGAETLVYNNIDWNNGAPSRGDADSDVLGYAWHFRYKAKTYTFMSAVADLFDTTVYQTLSDADINTDDGHTSSKADLIQKDGSTATHNISLRVSFSSTIKQCLIGTDSDSQKGKISDIKFVIRDSDLKTDGSAHNGGASTIHRDEDFDVDSGCLTITLSADVTNNADQIPVTAIITALEASSYVDTVTVFRSGGDVTASLVAGDVINTISSSNVESAKTKVGKTWLSHKDLLGEYVPSGVWDKFEDATDAQLREVNFAHQLASFCYYASNTYHMCLGFMSFSKPVAFNQIDLANYFGELPVYQGWNGKLSNEAIKTGGNGILGNKFLGGAKGYRYGRLKNGAISNGYAFGGFICTKGLGLPNKEGYGINQSDEKLDKNKFPVDIGRHIVLSAAWPIASATIGGVVSSFKTPISSILASRIYSFPVNNEPFGEVNGRLNSNLVLTSSESSLVSSGYAGDARVARVTVLNTDNAGNVYIANISTAAHPIDDYKRISTIRCVNRVINGLRNLAKGYIGTSFNSSNIISLQTAINGYLKSEQDVGVHQGAVAQIAYTRRDRINGNLKIKLRMVPPFSLETIEVETSILADASEL